MGVSGLLPLLKSIHKHTTLKAYAGQTLGVDGFGWLHRGAVACSFQLAFDKPTTQYVSFVVNRVRMLLDFGIIPYLVFDGDSLPSKAGTNTKRRQERDAAKELGMSLYKSGKKDQAMQELQKSVSVTPQMTAILIRELRRMNVQILVAPYEADAQLAYLEKEGIIDGILSEDSDLLVFGAQRLITKLDQYGSCIEINRADLVLNKDVSFAGWSDSMFRRMAILSGCDYLSNINGVGLRTAHGFVKKHKEIAKIARVMAFNGKYVISTDYLGKFEDAERTFLYHRVFCPRQGKMVFLNTLPPDVREDDMPYLGSYVDAETALGVACGDLNPKTKEPFMLSANMSKTPLARPVLQESRRQTIGGDNDLKPKRSLENFFKPHRRPLAELDPNSLTPSPSQQRVLERNRNASWEPHLAPHSAPALRRSATGPPSPGFTPKSATTGRSTYLTKAAALSTYKPVKRQRLCSESDEVSPSKEIKQSKFFPPVLIEQSPLTNKKTRDRRNKSAAFDVFSDDSVEGFMLGLEDPAPGTPTKDIEYPELPASPAGEDVSCEAEVVPQSSPTKASIVPIDSQSSHGTAEMNAVTIDSQSASQSTTHTEVNEDDHPDAFVSLLDYHVKKMNATTSRGMGRTFSCQSPQQQLAALASLSPIKSLLVPHNDVLGFDEAEPESEELASPQRAASSKFRGLSQTFSYQPMQGQTRALQSLGKVSLISNIRHGAVTPTSKGSEDATPPPSSPPEDNVAEAEGRLVRKLDIKSFQYVVS